jgi:hypothetical protein
MLKDSGKSRWNFVITVATQNYPATIEEPTTGRKKVMPVRGGTWHPLRSKQSAEGHGMIIRQTSRMSPGFIRAQGLVFVR